MKQLAQIKATISKVDTKVDIKKIIAMSFFVALVSIIVAIMCIGMYTTVLMVTKNLEMLTIIGAAGSFTAIFAMILRLIFHMIDTLKNWNDD